MILVFLSDKDIEELLKNDTKFDALLENYLVDLEAGVKKEQELKKNIENNGDKKITDMLKSQDEEYKKDYNDSANKFLDYLEVLKEQKNEN